MRVDSRRGRDRLVDAGADGGAGQMVAGDEQAGPPCFKIADVIAVPESPLDGIEALHGVCVVMKDGRVHRND